MNAGNVIRYWEVLDQELIPVADSFTLNTVDIKSKSNSFASWTNYFTITFFDPVEGKETTSVKFMFDSPVFHL
jgi:hypothetical protein